jgi:hypothetical protein
MHLIGVSAQEDNTQLAPPNAMTIVAMERQNLHEKIARLRALREAAEAEKAPAEAKRPQQARRWIPHRSQGT